MRRQLVPGPVVRLTVIKAKTRPGIEAKMSDAPLSGLIVIHIQLDPISYFMHNNLPNNANVYNYASTFYAHNYYGAQIQRV